MRFLRNWLRAERPSGVALNPKRTLELESSALDAFERCLTGVERLLGGHVARSEPASRIEATFGLVGSERLAVTLESLGENRTRVTIESRRGAIAAQARTSSYVDALANYLGRG